MGKVHIHTDSMGHAYSFGLQESSPSHIMAMEQRISALKLKARGYASVNQYDRANEVETEIAELTQQMAEMNKGTSDMKPGEMEALGRLLGDFIREEGQEPEHQTSDCAGVKDCGCGCKTKDAAPRARNIHIHLNR